MTTPATTRPRARKNTGHKAKRRPANRILWACPEGECDQTSRTPLGTIKGPTCTKHRRKMVKNGRRTS